MNAGARARWQAVVCVGWFRNRPQTMLSVCHVARACGMQ